MNWPRLAVLVSLVALAVASRLLPHPDNVTAVGGLAVFAGAMFRDRRLALGLPLAALFLSDLVVGLHAHVPVVYASFAASVLIGRWLAASRTVAGVAGATLLGAAQFFAVTNFACWVQFYPPTFAGFAECYASAVPYFRSSLAGDFACVTVLFGVVRAAEAAAPGLRERSTFPQVAPVA